MKLNFTFTLREWFLYSAVFCLAMTFTLIAWRHQSKIESRMNNPTLETMDQIDKVTKKIEYHEKVSIGSMYIVRALAYLKLDESEKAKEDFQRAISADHGTGSFLYSPVSLAKKFAERNDYETALNIHNTIVEKYPDTPLYHREYARFLALSRNSQVRDGAKAVEYAERAIALNRKPTRLRDDLWVLALAKAEAGDFDAAKAAAEEALTLPPIIDTERSKAWEEKELYKLMQQCDKKTVSYSTDW